MSVYIYCPRKSNGALELVKALGYPRLRKFDGLNFWDKNKKFLLNEGDVIVAWGTGLPELEGIRVLNGTVDEVNKYEEAKNLAHAGIPTVDVWARGYYTPANAIRRGVIGRSYHHVGGNDLLNGEEVRVDFWVKKEAFANEYRIHSFDGKSIRAGKKVVRDGFELVKEAEDWRPNANLSHPWIRSFDGGWRIKYDDFMSNNTMRELAGKAIKALGLTFGAVDIGEIKNGDGNVSYKVLEVNRAPGIEGNSVAVYAKAIQKWVENGGANPLKKRARAKL